jgi:hypothetical protein
MRKILGNFIVLFLVYLLFRLFVPVIGDFLATIIALVIAIALLLYNVFCVDFEDENFLFVIILFIGSAIVSLLFRIFFYLV